MAIWGILRKRMDYNRENPHSSARNMFLCERELERWLIDHPERRLSQCMKDYLMSEYNLSDNAVLNACKRVRYRLGLHETRHTSRIAPLIAELLKSPTHL